jgi:hypothetical protein
MVLAPRGRSSSRRTDVLLDERDPRSKRIATERLRAGRP